MTSQDETTDSKAKEEADESAATDSGDLPKVDFSTFVLSLGTTALYQLGVMPDPAGGESVEADPLVAQQTIDTLEMLRDKTLGNLDDSERQLVDSLLYELRMRFVESTR